MFEQTFYPAGWLDVLHSLRYGRCWACNLFRVLETYPLHFGSPTSICLSLAYVVNHRGAKEDHGEAQAVEGIEIAERQKDEGECDGQYMNSNTRHNWGL